MTHFPFIILYIVYSILCTVCQVIIMFDWCCVLCGYALNYFVCNLVMSKLFALNFELVLGHSHPSRDQSGVT